MHYNVASLGSPSLENKADYYTNSLQAESNCQKFPSIYQERSKH